MGSIPGRVKPATIKLVFVASLLTSSIKEKEQRLVGSESDEIENTKGVSRIRISKKNRQHNGQKKIKRSTKHTKLKIEKHEPHYKPGVNPGAPEG